jgi:hypothetical protein
MADSKITGLTADTSPTTDDLIVTVNDPAGTPANKKVTLAAIIGLIYPVGSIYISTSSTNPGTTFGVGTWSAYAQGEVLVGKASSGTFATAGATGGEETHTLTTTEMPAHTHAITAAGKSIGPKNAPSGSGKWAFSYSNTTSTDGDITEASSGSSGAHNNLQPYIVVYMWQRTA